MSELPHQRDDITGGLPIATHPFCLFKIPQSKQEVVLAKIKKILTREKNYSNFNLLGKILSIFNYGEV